MAVRTKEELLDLVKSRLGDDVSDEALEFIGDITDTIDDLAAKTTDNVNWKDRYEENDREWRQKYRDRFFNTTEEKGPEPDPVLPEKLTFENLFKQE